MTLICAPVKQIPSSHAVDLYEIVEGKTKKLFDRNGHLQFIDIDWEQSQSAAHNLIVSYHNFQETPDLEEILFLMQKRQPNGRYYKIATYANSTLDSLRMLMFQKNHPEVIGLCMGEHGTMTRILAPVMGSPIAYAPLQESDKNAPGQLLLSELEVIYHFRKLKQTTAIYGLIGDPVHHSIGHLFHNEQFFLRGVDAVYVKMRIKPEELPSFFQMIEQLPILGLSVTAPLKEEVVAYLDENEQEESGAVNTIYRVSNKWKGVSTDGPAALKPLGGIKKKRVVLLGAGGAAKAIAHELLKQGASLTIVNRTVRKGRDLAQKLSCAFSETVPPHDVLINATSSPDPLRHYNFLAEATVMDISTRKTRFLALAESAGCTTIDGFSMYFHQALAQSRIFTGGA